MKDDVVWFDLGYKMTLEKTFEKDQDYNQEKKL
jgi:hypothetical protein